MVVALYSGAGFCGFDAELGCLSGSLFCCSETRAANTVGFKKIKLIILTVLLQERVTSGGVHLRGLAHGQHCSEETSQRWRATVSDLTNPRREPQISRTDSDVFNLVACRLD